MAVTTALLAPISGYAALLLKERFARLLRESRAYLVLRRKGSLADTLREQRAELLTRIERLVELYRNSGDEASD